MSDKRKRRDEKPDMADDAVEKDTGRGDNSLQENPTKPRQRRLSERGVGSAHARRSPTPDSSPTSKTRF